MSDITDRFRTLPRRPRNAHKGDFGRLLLICGSEGLTGAARLAGAAALRSGAGLVSVGTPRSVYPIVAAGQPELMVFPLPDDGSGKLSLAALDPVLSRLENCNACLAGPGLGRSPELDILVREILTKSPCTVVLDADGINAVAGDFPKTRRPCVITPHPGEYARLTDLDALEFAARHDCVLVLKGHNTIVCDTQGRFYAYEGANPGMSVGGSGDVLAGITASLIAQANASPEIWNNPELSQISALAVYLHGEAGKACASELGEYSMLPSDVISKLPELMRDYNSTDGDSLN